MDVMGTHLEGISRSRTIRSDPLPRAYVANGDSQNVMVIDIVTRSILVAPMVGVGPVRLEGRTDDSAVYVMNITGAFGKSTSSARPTTW